MKILEFIFKLLYQFITFEDGRYVELKDKAFAWQNKIEKEIDDKNLTPEQTRWYHKIVKYDKEWWFQLGMAMFFLFAVKSVRSWLFSDFDDDDDDDDDEEVTVRKSHLSKLNSLVPASKF